MKKVLIFSISLVLVIILGNYGFSHFNNQEISSTNSQVYVHELGETAVLSEPQKIVVFDWATLDTLQALDLSDKVVGVPSYLPEYLAAFSESQYTVVGTAKEADLEAVANLNPDLILIGGRQKDLYEQLSQIAPTLYLGLDYTDYFQSVENNLQILGQVFNKKQSVETTFNTIMASIEDVRAKIAEQSPTALVTLANDGKLSAFGQKSRFGFIYDVFGFTNVDPTIETSTHGQSISFEYVLEKNPDYLYVVDRGAVVGGNSSAQQTLDNAIIQQTRAAQNKKIIYLDAQYWYAASGGIQALTHMVAEIDESMNQ